MDIFSAREFLNPNEIDDGRVIDFGLRKRQFETRAKARNYLESPVMQSEWFDEFGDEDGGVA